MHTVLLRTFTIVSHFSKFHFEAETLKKTLHKNAYPSKFVDKCIERFVNNIFVHKPVVKMVPKLELTRVWLHLGNISSITKKSLNRYIVKRLKFYKLSSIILDINDCVPEKVIVVIMTMIKSFSNDNGDKS